MFGRSSRFTAALAGVMILSSVFSGTRPVRAQSINTAALYFNGHLAQYRSPVAALPSGSSVTLHFRTAHDGATTVTVRLDRLYPSPLGTPMQIPMSLDRAGSSSQFDLWRATLTPSSVGIWGFDFLIQDGSAQVWYADDPNGGTGGGGTAATSPPTAQYHLVVYQPDFTVPSWLKNAVIYEIFPDRFYNGDNTNDSKVMNPAYRLKATIVKNWNSPEPSTADYNQLNYYGGDLQGIIDKLPYLKGLGVNVLYLTPIFQAGTNHGYDTANYMEIAPHLGTLKTFKALVAAAHKDHMKVILDGVFNHTSSDSVYFNQYGTFNSAGAYQSQSSPYYGWYTFQSWPKQYSSYPGVSTMPELNESDAVKNFIFQSSDSVAQYWLAQGADGWRLDHTVGKSDTYWQEFRTAVKGRFSNDALICECDYSQSAAIGIPKLLGNMFDGDMNYVFQSLALAFFAHGRESPLGIFPFEMTASQFLGLMVELTVLIPRPADYASMNLIGSHDTDRALDNVWNSIPEMRQLAALQMTSLGTPMIYYGDEAGLTGSGQPDTAKRKPFPWSHPNKSLQAFYSRVIHLRLANPALRDGSVIPLFANDALRLVAFERQDAKQMIPVIINDGGAAESVYIPTTGMKQGSPLTDSISGKRYTVSGPKISVSVAARSTAILIPAT